MRLLPIAGLLVVAVGCWSVPADLRTSPLTLQLDPGAKGAVDLVISVVDKSGNSIPVEADLTLTFAWDDDIALVILNGKEITSVTLAKGRDSVRVQVRPKAAAGNSVLHVDTPEQSVRGTIVPISIYARKGGPG